MRDSVAPLVDEVKTSVVTILSTKIIRRVLREDPWSAMLREQFGLGGPQDDPGADRRAWARASSWTRAAWS